RPPAGRGAVSERQRDGVAGQQVRRERRRIEVARPNHNVFQVPLLDLSVNDLSLRQVGRIGDADLGTDQRQPHGSLRPARRRPTASSRVGTPLLGFRKPKYPTRNVPASAPSCRRISVRCSPRSGAHNITRSMLLPIGTTEPRTPAPAVSRSPRSVKIAAWLLR